MSTVKRLHIPSALNLSGIKPTEFKVLVKPTEETGVIKLKGGGTLYKPDEVKERDEHASMEGTLIDVSPLAFRYDEWPENARKPQVGDTVVFARYSGINIDGNDGGKYRLMNDKDVVAIREAAR